MRRVGWFCLYWAIGLYFATAFIMLAAAPRGFWRNTGLVAFVVPIAVAGFIVLVRAVWVEAGYRVRQ
jgi:hypothetical protein